MGVSDITLITPGESKAALETALATHPALTSLPGPRAEVLAPEGLELTTGTGELLGLPEVQKVVVSDFVVLPCDLVSELDGSRVLEQWMTLNPLSKSVRKGGLSVFYPTYGLEGISHKKDETDFIATVPLPAPSVPPPSSSLRPNIEELVMCMPTDTLNDKLEDDKGHFRLRRSLLQKHPRVKLRMKYRDAHFYVFPLWVKDFVAKNPRFESVSEDVLGWWARAGWQEGLARKLGLVDEKEQELAKSGASLAEEETDVAALSSTKCSTTGGDARPDFATRVQTGTSRPTSIPAVPALLAYIHPTTSPNTPQPLIRRIDTTAQLASLSLYLARQPLSHPLSPEQKIHRTAQVGSQTRISAEDSLVGSNVTFGIRCNFKECVIGANCEIGANVRLSKCVLMDGVTVGDGVVMTGCVIGRRARVKGVAVVESGKKGGAEGGTRLTECEVAPGFVVEARTEAKGEKLMGFDTEDGEGLDGDEDGGEDDETENE